jgi:Ca-activated chloride channel family protein
MKIILHILCVLMLTPIAFSQEWRDSLLKAREAYTNQDYEKALDLYRGVLRKIPNNIDLSDEIAQTAYKAKYYDAAEKVYSQRANEHVSDAKKASSFHNLGNTQMKQENYAGAIQSYKEALRYNPTNTETRYNLSEAIRRMKREEQKKNQNNDKPQNKQPNTPPKKPSDKNEDQQNKSQLPDKMVDRMLDQLMKQEAETKKKTTGSKQGKGTNKSGKDW